ncbi:hypothetical protein NC652_024330 [Populus alba x Populus x berolinensis]|nr:hypothetical protein NC652_024330 [Populus alba x Populus x berolinensis]
MEARGGSSLRRVLVLAFCVAGIWSAYIYQGVLQETLSTKRFGADGKRFEQPCVLKSGAKCSLLNLVLYNDKDLVDGQRRRSVVVMTGVLALQIQLVLLMGIEAPKVYQFPCPAYTVPEYLCTFLVAGGVSTFALLKTSSKTINKLARPNAPIGYGLCFLNLAFDGFTNATQDSLKSSYKNRFSNCALLYVSRGETYLLGKRKSQGAWF